MHEHAPDFGDSALGSGIDLLKIRNDTPGCLDKVFLDGAGSALPPRVVVEAVIEHLEYEAQVGGYAAMNDRQTEFDEIYSVLGTLVNCAPHQVALTGSATAAWLRAVTSIPLHEGDTVLVTGDEYASNVIPLIQSARRAGAAVEFLPAGAEEQRA